MPLHDRLPIAGAVLDRLSREHAQRAPYLSGASGVDRRRGTRQLVPLVGLVLLTGGAVLLTLLMPHGRSTHSSSVATSNAATGRRCLMASGTAERPRLGLRAKVLQPDGCGSGSALQIQVENSGGFACALVAAASIGGHTALRYSATPAPGFRPPTGDAGSSQVSLPVGNSMFALEVPGESSGDLVLELSALCAGGAAALEVPFTLSD